jgi:hypothetical protein
MQLPVGSKAFVESRPLGGYEDTILKSLHSFVIHEARRLSGAAIIFK